MTQEKFTPGPWELAESPHDRVKLINDSKGNTIGAYVDFSNLADARLIAAAPELLEALQECEKYMEYYCPKETNVLDKDCTPALIKARAAIAKARSAK